MGEWIKISLKKTSFKWKVKMFDSTFFENKGTFFLFWEQCQNRAFLIKKEKARKINTNFLTTATCWKMFKKKQKIKKKKRQGGAIFGFSFAIRKVQRVRTLLGSRAVPLPRWVFELINLLSSVSFLFRVWQQRGLAQFRWRGIKKVIHASPQVFFGNNKLAASSLFQNQNSPFLFYGWFLSLTEQKIKTVGSSLVEQEEQSTENQAREYTFPLQEEFLFLTSLMGVEPFCTQPGGAIFCSSPNVGSSEKKKTPKGLLLSLSVFGTKQYFQQTLFRLTEVFLGSSYYCIFYTQPHNIFCSIMWGSTQQTFIKKSLGTFFFSKKNLQRQYWKKKMKTSAQKVYTLVNMGRTFLRFFYRRLNHHRFRRRFSKYRYITLLSRGLLAKRDSLVRVWSRQRSIRCCFFIEQTRQPHNGCRAKKAPRVQRRGSRKTKKRRGGRSFLLYT